MLVLWYNVRGMLHRYISGRLLLNDLTKTEEERMSACMQQLDQILMTQASTVHRHFAFS